VSFFWLQQEITHTKSLICIIYGAKIDTGTPAKNLGVSFFNHHKSYNLWAKSRASQEGGRQLEGGRTAQYEQALLESKFSLTSRSARLSKPGSSGLFFARQSTERPGGNLSCPPCCFKTLPAVLHWGVVMNASLSAVAINWVVGVTAHESPPQLFC